jgi:DNA-binding transcriptional MerR regulator
MKEYSSKEVMEKTGISARNLKFWLKEYNISPIKKGRQNFFDEKSFVILKIINLFSEHNYFTGKLLNVYIKKILGNANEDELKDIRTFMNSFLQIEKDADFDDKFCSLLFDDCDKKTVKTKNIKSFQSKKIQNDLPVELL